MSLTDFSSVTATGWMNEFTMLRSKYLEGKPKKASNLLPNRRATFLTSFALRALIGAEFTRSGDLWHACMLHRLRGGGVSRFLSSLHTGAVVTSPKTSCDSPSPPIGFEVTIISGDLWHFFTDSLAGVT